MNFAGCTRRAVYVVIEDVLRYLINDLGVEAQTRRWHDTLIESEKQFKENFNRW